MRLDIAIERQEGEFPDGQFRVVVSKPDASFHPLLTMPWTDSQSHALRQFGKFLLYRAGEFESLAEKDLTVTPETVKAALAMPW